MEKNLPQNYNFNPYLKVYNVLHSLPQILDLKMTLFSRSKHFLQPVLSASHVTQTEGNGQKRNLAGLWNDTKSIMMKSVSLAVKINRRVFVNHLVILNNNVNVNYYAPALFFIVSKSKNNSNTQLWPSSH